MKCRFAIFFLMSPLFVGCHFLTKSKDLASPKIVGETVLFSEKSPQLSYIQAVPAEKRQSEDVDLFGHLVWDEDVTVRVFSPVSGRVKKVLADLGQVVSKGDPLAIIDSPDFGQIQADSKKSVSDLALADRNLQRLKELYEHGASPKKDLDAAQAEYEKALSESKKNSARLQLFGNPQGLIDEQYQLKAPLEGMVMDKNISPGQEVRPDQMLANSPQFFSPLVILSDPKKLWVNLDVSESYLPLIKPGEKLKIHSKIYPGESFDGVVEVVGNALDPSTRTVKARGRVDNSSEKLKAEMYITVDLVDQDNPPGVDVPAKSVFVVGEKKFVFVESSPHQFKRVEIKVGPEHDGEVAILEGLQIGQKVVTDGALLLEELLESKEG